MTKEDWQRSMLGIIEVVAITLTKDDAARFIEKMRDASRNMDILWLVTNGPANMMVKTASGLIPTMARLQREM